MTLSLSSFVRSSVTFFFFSVFGVCCLEKLQGCFKNVSWPFQKSFKGVSRKFPGCFKEVSRVFQGGFKGVKKNSKDVSMKF